jgi:hypothetical protein
MKSNHSVQFEDGWYNVYNLTEFVDGFDNYGDALSFMYYLEASDEEWEPCLQ